jgi:cell division protein FtsQ
MTFNWKKSLIIVFDIAIAAYLVLAITAFNKPAEKATVCSEVKIDIENDIMDGFLNAKAIKTILEKVHLYPLGRPMAEVSAREIEETLRKNPFIEMAECHKTQSGHVCIRLKQRMPVVHVMADNNENYYVDTNGGIMPETRVATDNIIATGHIS